MTFLKENFIEWSRLLLKIPSLTSTTVVVLVRLRGGCVVMSSGSLGLIMSEQRLRSKWPFKSLLTAASVASSCCWSPLLAVGDCPSGEVVVGENHWDTREVTRFRIDYNREISIRMNIRAGEVGCSDSLTNAAARHFY